MVDSEWNPSRDGQEIWSVVGYRVGNGSSGRHGAEANLPGVFLSFQPYLRRAWQNARSVQSTVGGKDPSRLAPLHSSTRPALARTSTRLWRADSFRRSSGLRDDVVESERKKSSSERSHADDGAHDCGRSAGRTHESAFPPRAIRSAASRRVCKDGTRVYAASRNAHGSRVRRLVESEHVRGSECGETRRWPDEPLDRPSRSPHLHDRDYATVESPFRHDNSLCHDPCSPICQRNGVA